MASQLDEEVTVGAIITRTLETVVANVRVALVFIVVLSAIGSLGDYLIGEKTSEELLGAGIVVQLIFVGAAIIGGYLLIEAMLDKAGLRSYRGSQRYFAYFGQSIVLTFGCILGLLLLIVPGIILWVRWSLASSLFIGRGGGVFEALGESWRKTKGYGWRIFLAACAFGIAFVFLIVLVAVSAGELTQLLSLGSGSVIAGAASVVGIVLPQLATNAVTVFTCALGVSLLGLIDPAGDSLSEVFE